MIAELAPRQIIQRCVTTRFSRPVIIQLQAPKLLLLKIKRIESWFRAISALPREWNEVHSLKRQRLALGQLTRMARPDPVAAVVQFPRCPGEWTLIGSI